MTMLKRKLIFVQTWIYEVSCEVWSFVVILNEIGEKWRQMISWCEQELAVCNVCTHGSQVKVVGEGMHVQQHLYVVHFIQEEIDGKLQHREWCILQCLFIFVFSSSNYLFYLSAVVFNLYCWRGYINKVNIITGKFTIYLKSQAASLMLILALFLYFQRSETTWQKGFSYSKRKKKESQDML